MNTIEIINLCLEQGIQLSVEDGSLQIDAPKQGVSNEMISLLRDNKAELIEMIESFKKKEQGLQRQILKKSEITGPIPLSFAQQRLWVMDRIENGTSQHNMSAPFLLEGELNLAAFEYAIEHIIARHEVLRSVYVENSDGSCEQVVRAHYSSDVPLLDLSGQDKEAAVEQAFKLSAEFAQKPFNLTDDTMLKAMIMKVDEQTHYAAFSMHHIASDGWSIGIFIKEFNELYRAHVTNTTPQLESLEVQYKDFAFWQRDWMQGEVYEREMQYWVDRLEDAPPLHNLPLDNPRPEQRNILGQSVQNVLNKDLTSRLKQFCQANNITLFMALQTLYALTLCKWSNESEIVMGTPVAGRMHQNTEALIGFFLNNLALRTDCSGNPTFAELIAQNRKHILDAFEHQNLPYDALVEEINPERSAAYNSIFQVWFVLQNHESSDFILPDLKMSMCRVEGFIHFDLSLEAIETKGGEIELSWQYQTDLFEHNTICSLSKSFEALLDSALSNSELPIDELSLVNASSETPWDKTLSHDFPANTLVDAFNKQAQLNPDATALTFQGSMMSYKQLNERANQVANYLQSMGVSGNQPVGLCFERGPQMLVALLGILKSGAAYVPLDPSAPEARLNYIANEAGIDVVLASRPLTLDKADSTVLTLDLDAPEAWFTEASSELPASVPGAEDIAYIIYTSGSTGKPKGVAVQHKNLTNLSHAMQHILAERGLDGSYNWLWNAPVVFDASVQAITQLAFGVELHLITEEQRRSTSFLINYIQDNDIELLDTTPSLMSLLLQESKATGIALPSTLIGGEPIDAQLWKDIAAHYQDREAFSLNVYGPTECTVNATFADIDNSTKPTIGSGLPNVQLYVMNDAQQLMPTGAKGELYIGGAGVAAGYFENPELTERAFIEHATLGRLYKTGDIARWMNNGKLEYIGRNDFQIKLRGYRIELEEIECTIKELDIVKDAAVLVVNEQLVAYIVGDEPVQQAALSHMKSRLPTYMVAADIVLLDEMPVTGNGKRDTKQLRALYEETAQQQDYFAPETEMEAKLQGIWQELLGKDQISVEDNFFEVGGHSLMGIRLASACREKLGIELPLKALMEAPTIRGLARQCEWQEKQRQVLAASQHQSSSDPSERIVI
ncbi:non-ribosomal peptide synthetase [Pseudoalteromonas rubra]|uniref:Non-ribosomal peptide synthetase n=1 Tax=Pseudoalteromonas rubra TaxID=43658 RepID=A0A4Q7ENB8_9GAMM|nr:non-ribosomal peptide synthetase [Pseudoalteromonas rubra]RZM84972.1 non-ribosomal peptide synthetase [Pseudoalteromonas rubra]